MTRPLGREVLVDGLDRGVPLLVGDLEDVVEPVRRGLVGAEDAEVVGVRAARPRRASAPSTRVASAVVAPGLVDRRRRSRGSRAARGRGARAPPFVFGLALIRRSPSGASAASSGTSAPVVVEQLLGPVAAQPLLELAAGAPRSSAPRPAAPGARATCPRPAARRPRAARSSPSASGTRSSPRGGRRAPRSSSSAKRPWIESGVLVVEAGGEEERLVAVAAQQRRELVLRDPREHGRVRDLVAVQVQDRQHARRRAPGSRTCSSASSSRAGPVSASPSPTTQATVRPGSSKAAP